MTAAEQKAPVGLPGVMVSNGLEVTVTGSDGRWSLPVRSGDHIFVITPSHWTTVGRGPSSFSYLHQPEGTPIQAKLCAPAIEPTGALPESIDFPLLRQPQSQCFEVLLFADTQAADAKELGYVRQVLLSATRRTNAAFAIHHGDAMADDLALFPQYLNILNETGLAWHHCPGNHDMNLDSEESTIVACTPVAEIVTFSGLESGLQELSAAGPCGPSSVRALISRTALGPRRKRLVPGCGALDPEVRPWHRIVALVGSEEFSICSTNLCICNLHRKPSRFRQAASRSFFSNPDWTIRMAAGSKLRASAKASAGEPESQVSTSASSLRSTGIRSWLI